MRRYRAPVAFLIAGLLLGSIVSAPAAPTVKGGSSSFFPGQATYNSVCLDTANKDTGVSRSAAGVLRTDNCAGTAATSYAAKFTTTGTGTYAYTLSNGEGVGVASGTELRLRSTLGAGAGGASGDLDILGGSIPITSSSQSAIRYTGSFVPGSGSSSFAALHVNPTINGTSSGAAYGLGVASKTNTLTGGTIKLASFGTTTTDLFTGYTALADIDTTGLSRATLYGSMTRCANTGSPATCAAAPAGSVVIAATATSVVVNTTAVTANSQVFAMIDRGLGTLLSVTCDTTSDLTTGSPAITARTAGTSFTIAVPVAPAANPMCLSYFIVN